ncbi:hypothetical protein IAR55_003885 [Kwoniella newhampshirensis]|uniref:ThuA-like domain-containing protein n=1 Tax=Kwoniella newhampshirensis TaxID=1651941 RepID=A0AAW0YY18_9TREE
MMSISTTTVSAQQAQPQPQSTPRVLVYTATAGFRHDSIPTAIQVLGNIAGQYGVEFVFSEDRSLFTNETLSGFDGVMFVSNSDEVLDAPGQAALQTFFQSGGVYTGVHAASACLFQDNNYLQAVGAYFDYHPQLQQATFERLNSTFPATANVPDRWTFVEEVYHFRSDPRSEGAVVIMTVDESSYNNDGTSTGNYPPEGSPHPIAWYIDSPNSAQPLLDSVTKAGRSFYTSLGHTNETWQNSTFQGHVMEGLLWALGGASTRAYGVGLVGNGTASASATSTSSSPSSTASAGATGSGTAAVSSTGGVTGASASASGSSAPASSQSGSGAPGYGQLVFGKMAAVGLGMVGAVVLGTGMVL